jgi:hypothetical protein
MVDESFFSPVKKHLTAARDIFIFLPANPSLDQVAASLGLSLSLKKTNREINVACPTQMRVEFADLVGVNQVSHRLGGRNLTISFDYQEESIEKVSYNIEDKKFNLVVQPKTGHPPLSSKKVDYFYTGDQADLVFTIGVRHLKELGSFYHTSGSFFDSQKIVDIDTNPKPKRFSQNELIINTASLSEIIARMIAFLGLPIDQDIASNLYLGIEKTTRTFSSSRVGATTFEAAAFCLRSGARRSPVKASTPPLPQKQPSLKPMSPQVSAQKKPAIPDQSSQLKTQGSSPASGQKPSSDWFEPKVYQGSTKI